ncbi:hypothetical protein JYU04_04650, partial [Dehalococcoides mccartyi]|nr:hypothetical protein [Dehalococcoides mccartyi]
EILEDRDGGFGDTVSIINSVASSEVLVTSIDDDGRIVNVSAESADYPEMLGYIRLLESIPQFEHVQVLNLVREASGGGGGNGEPAQQSGGTALIEIKVVVSLVISRVEIENSQPLIGEELAVFNIFE